MVVIVVVSAVLAMMALVFLAILLAALGQSVGLRKFYVSVLLKVFEVSTHTTYTVQVQQQAHYLLTLQCSTQMIAFI